MGTHREETKARLVSEQFDLIIIGGGVIGVAAARDASLRGLKVALVDANDTGAGTSSRSSKLVHGGLRYLEQGDLGLVFESVSERRILSQVAPHLVRPKGFLFPIYPQSPVTVAKLRLGLVVYEGLALFRSPRMHVTWKPAQVRKEIPALRSEGLRGAPLYWDCMTDDARLTLETLLDAESNGAAALTYAPVVGIEHDDAGRVCGVRVRDRMAGDVDGPELRVKGRAIINATGPWSDRVRGLTVPDSRQLRCTKGVHIVVAADRLPTSQVIVGTHPRDQRVFFVIPWGEAVYIGTTDTDYEGDPRDVAATREDIDYLFEAVSFYFPTAALRYDDVSSTWAGLRPLIRADGLSPSQVSREHTITVDPDGLISIAGGKLTTCRRMGAEVVQRAVDWLILSGHTPEALRPVDTSRLPLPGAVGWPEDDEEGESVARMVAEAAAGALSEQTVRYLTDRYGTRAIGLARLAQQDQALRAPLVPGRPEILAQVDWAVQHELACTVTDVMERRTQLFFRDRDQGLTAVEAVSVRMATLLGWDEATRERSAEQYRQEVALSRSWREGEQRPGAAATG